MPEGRTGLDGLHGEQPPLWVRLEPHRVPVPMRRLTILHT